MVRMVFFSLLLVFVACSDNSIRPTDTLPVPRSVSASDVPPSGDGVFYLLHVAPGDDPGPVLLEALRRGVNLLGAWQPTTGSPCEAPNTTTALVVQVSGPAGHLVEIGFTSDPAPWRVNCGIYTFMKYDFQAGSSRQDYLFEIGYENHAWGLQINGFVVDVQGCVYRYNHDQAEWRPADPDAITAAELGDKFRSREQVGTVDTGTLNAMAALIEAASTGTFSDPVSVCADFGGQSFLAYLYDGAGNVYRPVLLYTAGDVATKNLSTSAETLYNWLFTIGGRPKDCLP